MADAKVDTENPTASADTVATEAKAKVTMVETPTTLATATGEELVLNSSLVLHH